MMRRTSDEGVEISDKTVSKVLMRWNGVVAIVQSKGADVSKKMHSSPEKYTSNN